MLLGDHIRTATTRSLTAVNVLAVDRDAFQALFSTLPPLRTFVSGSSRTAWPRWPPITWRARSWPMTGAPSLVG